MKKSLMLVIGLFLFSGVSYAACVLGQFCADDNGAYVAGTIHNGNGNAVPSITAAQELTFTPNTVGQLVWCSNCSKFNGATGMLCISTATKVASYMAVSTATAVTVCQ